MTRRWTLLAAVLLAAGCLDVTPDAPQGAFPCPDGICPDGQRCGSDQICHPYASSSGSSGGSAGTGTGPSGTGGATGGSGSGATSTSGMSSGSGSTSGGSSGGTTAAGSSTGGGTSGSSTGGSATGGSSSSTGGTTGSSVPANYGGEWDMSFSHVSLAQNGTIVSGRYHDWGVTYANPAQAGTIQGTVAGNAFTGSFRSNDASVAGTISWTLTGGTIWGSFTYGGAMSYPWCGVAAGHGTPLPVGCGWSDSFTINWTTPYTFTQVADEVTGQQVFGPMAGIVSDYRLNGAGVCVRGGCTPGTPHRLSYAMSRDGTQFSGNYFQWNGSGNYNAECGGRKSTSSPLPATCLGGGGIYDGTWFTNVGTVTLTQPLLQQANPAPTAAVTGLWFPWGPDPVEYPISGTAIPHTSTGCGGLADCIPTRTHLTWTDSSPLGGADVTANPSDATGITLDGQAANGLLWCGVDYGPDPFATAPWQGDGGAAWSSEPIGVLFSGCGLTGNQWTLWPPVPGSAATPSASGQLLQTRGAVSGSTDFAGLDGVTGTVAFAVPDGGSGPWTIVTGSWSDPLSGDGGFSWYVDSQDQTFAGDYASPDGGAAWCGSTLGTMPSPCFE